MSEIADDLDSLGILTGTDKNLFSGDYLRHYDLLFRHLRHEVFTLIEIGVFQGQSLDLWKRYFTRARIVGVDINPNCARFADDRVTVRIGDIEDPELLLGLAAEFSPLIVIDDGSHRADHQIWTFERLFPAVQPEGFYIVEDLHFHHAEPDASRLRGMASMSPIDYFLGIARYRLASPHHQRQFSGFDSYLGRTVDSISFIQQAVVLRKRKRSIATEERIEKVRGLVEKTDHFLNWLQLGIAYLDIGRLHDAIRCARRSIEAKPTEVAPREWLSVMLERDGDIAGAITALEPVITASEPGPDIKARAVRRIEELRRRET